ncbi:MAG: DEAD/DEAH box helicase [Clostridiales bacterium]|jgi:superfamily II DNA or RNA helicase|nr:DEAD/DEAH box helicase [Clostridiales bacterium]
MYIDFDALYNEARGESFAAGKRRFYDNRVRGLTTSMRDGKFTVHAVVAGARESHRASLTFDEKGGLYDYACDCGHDNGLDGPCRHIIAAALSFEEKNPAQTPERGGAKPTDPAAMTLIAAYNKRRHDRQFFRADGDIELIPVVELAESGAQVRFRLDGGKKQYVIKDIAEFSGCMATGGYRRYGVDLEFLHVKSNFTERSRALIDFIAGTLDNARPDVQQGVKFKDVLTLKPADTDDFFTLCAGCLIHMGKSDFVFIEPPETRFDAKILVEQREKGFEIGAKPENPVFIKGKKRDYVYSENRIYPVEKSYFETASAFYTALRFKKKLFVAAADMSAFYNSVLAALSGLFDMETQADLSGYEAVPLKCRIYIDGAEAGVALTVESAYDEQKFDLLSDSAAIDVVRDHETENELRGVLAAYFPAFPKLILTRDDDIYAFLREGLPRLFGYAEVFMAESMNKMKVKGSPRIGVGVRVRNSLLELELSAEDYTPEELKAIIGAYREKRRYVRLSGGFVSLEDVTVGALSDILEVAAPTETGFAVERRYAPYINEELQHGFFALNRDSAFKNLINSLQTAENADIEVPGALNGIMRNYQKSGYRWLKTLAANEFGGILADDMGLGKTLQMIALLIEPGTKSIVLCPTTLMLNWVGELNKFAPGLSVLVIAGPASERRRLIGRCRAYDVVITSYDLLRRDSELYAGLVFDYAVADEAQYIKNPETLNALAVKSIEARHRFALTGTPMENNLSELWSVFDFIMPMYLGTYRDFRVRYEANIVKDDAAAAEKLRRLIAPFVLRRLKADVLTELPPKVESVVKSPNEDKQRALYDASLGLIRESLKAGREVNRVVLLGMLTKLREIACDPALVYADYDGNSAKLDTCLGLIESAAGGGHKILLFSQFTQMLEILRKKLLERGVTHYVLKGDTPKNERQRLINRFNGDDTQVFLISLRAGGTGINLTGADIVIHYDPWWNESVMNQATDRAYRMGQDKSVQVYKLILSDSIEEKILELQEKKSALSGKVVGGENDLGEILAVLKGETENK